MKNATHIRRRGRFVIDSDSDPIADLRRSLEDDGAACCVLAAAGVTEILLQDRAEKPTVVLRVLMRETDKRAG